MSFDLSKMKIELNKPFDYEGSTYMLGKIKNTDMENEMRFTFTLPMEFTPFIKVRTCFITYIKRQNYADFNIRYDNSGKDGFFRGGTFEDFINFFIILTFSEEHWKNPYDNSHRHEKIHCRNGKNECCDRYRKLYDDWDSDKYRFDLIFQKEHIYNMAKQLLKNCICYSCSNFSRYFGNFCPVIEEYKEVVIEKLIKVPTLSSECTICYENKIDHTFECGHVICGTCGKKCDRCPSCKKTGKLIKLFVN